MGKNKLAKFADMAALPNVYEYPFGVLRTGVQFPFRGEWRAKVFGNDAPIVLELGCGRGEYTVEMGRMFPDKNFIGVDIKGNRMWTGATTAHREELSNVAFLRTEIEFIETFFAPGEVDEIWITFPDPQMKKVRKRLTSVRFMQMYKRILASNGVVHLKTDSRFLYTFTSAMARHNGLEVIRSIEDIDKEVDEEDPLRKIRTYYESQWRERGLTIKYIVLSPALLTDHSEDPDIEIEPDSYRSFNRERRGSLNLKSNI
ncbi:tRNA (guanine-N7)-methyltransferase [Porphyromonas sp. COT-108 OH2963]|uniref:tRNA (guanosine(46)-N7)-methyltransferase TrmB n=1 Tax=Porphyromonas sp. COT-108 OH2963 TaxID=1515614 RepID=UPI00052D1FEC|nr:tRNA (guanosine(46)-N7)-methyltransferase TrmB [Porphyromonas sp. COT-108 OH2963]KGN95548.1 tRNA (guanine-N7)-methyltransferase [Porphyromonas sp. COT-108 OH2963]